MIKNEFLVKQINFSLARNFLRTDVLIKIEKESRKVGPNFLTWKLYRYNYLYIVDIKHAKRTLKWYLIVHNIWIWNNLPFFYDFLFLFLITRHGFRFRINFPKKILKLSVINWLLSAKLHWSAELCPGWYEVII